MESGVISMQDIFVFERHALDEQERVVGRFISTGVRPRFADRCKIFGIPINDKVFSPSPSRDAADLRSLGGHMESR